MSAADAEDAWPDVRVVVFHLRSLHVEGGGAGHAHGALRPDVLELIARLRHSHVRLASLATADEAAQLLAANARAEALVAALRGASDAAPGAFNAVARPCARAR